MAQRTGSARMTRFPAAVKSKLGYYVYVYVDPRDDRVFYVGQGQKDRALVHLSDRSECAKVQHIAGLRKIGLEPRIEILAHDLADQEAARTVEAACIDLLGIQSLTNTVRGWRSLKYGRRSIGELIALYDPEPASVVEPALLIRIPRLFRYGMSATDLYDATRGAWKLGKRRDKIQLVLAVFDNVVQEVYEVAAWFPAGTTLSGRGTASHTGRFEFVGRIAAEALRNKYRLRTVSHYLGVGKQNPVTYVNV